MQYVALGRTGLQVSRLCLGTMNFGSWASEPDSHAILDRALDEGVNFIDTADAYGGKEHKGRTEEIIGRWIAQGGRRDRIVLATKVHGQMGPGPNDGGLSAYHIRRACDESLRRLQTDHIDIYQMHHIRREVPWEEIWQAMETLVRQGKVVYVGSSNFAAWDIATANQTATRRGFLGLVSEQSKYSLACRHVELEVLPCCRAYGVGLIPYSPLGAGILGGVLEKPKDGRRAENGVRRKVERLREPIQAYEDLCHELGEAPANVALAWLLAQPGVAAPIIGPRTLDQLTGALRAIDLRLGEEALRRLDAIWPGPGGSAPEAYAW